MVFWHSLMIAVLFLSPGISFTAFGWGGGLGGGGGGGGLFGV